MKCDKCNKEVEEIHSKSEYLDLRLSEQDRLKQKKKLEGLWLCGKCFNTIVRKYNLPSYEINED